MSPHSVHHKLVILLGFSCTALAIISSGTSEANNNNSDGDLHSTPTTREGGTPVRLVLPPGYHHNKEMHALPLPYIRPAVSLPFLGLSITSKPNYKKLSNSHSRPYVFVKGNSNEQKHPNDSREKIKSKYKVQTNKDNVAAGSSYYDKGYAYYGGHDDLGFPYHDSGQIFGDKDVSEYYNYHHHGYGDHKDHGPFYHGGHSSHYIPDHHHPSALKGLLLPLAGVALLGAAAALVTNPVLLQLGVISGRRKRRSIDRIPEKSISVYDSILSKYQTSVIDKEDFKSRIFSKPIDD